jgi:hypothetical protein
MVIQMEFYNRTFQRTLGRIGRYESKYRNWLTISGIILNDAAGLDWEILFRGKSTYCCTQLYNNLDQLTR